MLTTAAIFLFFGLFWWWVLGWSLYPLVMGLSLTTLLVVSAAWLRLAIWWMDHPAPVAAHSP